MMTLARARNLLFALVAFFGVLMPASAQPYTPPKLISDLLVYLPTNGVGAIKAADVRNYLTNLINSTVALTNLVATAPAHQFVTGFTSGGATPGSPIFTQPTYADLAATGSVPVIVTQTPTVFFFQGNGAHINRMADRLFIGGAVANSGNCCTDTSWVGTANTPTPGVGTEGLFAMLSVVSSPSNAQSTNAAFFASQSLVATAAAASTYAISLAVFNNNATLGTYIWGIYGECYQMNAVVGGVACVEFEPRNTGGINYIQDPFTIGGKYITAYEAGCGAGQVATTFPCTTAFVIFPNPNKFNEGLLFAANSIAASGPGGSIPAIAMPTLYDIQWYSAAGTVAVQLTTDSSGDIILNSPANNANLFIQPSTAGKQAFVNFFDSSTLKWTVGKQLDNSFLINDPVNVANPLTISAAGAVTLGESGKLVSITGILAIPQSTPASSSAACVTGTLAADTGFLYECTSTNTWKRATLASF